MPPLIEPTYKPVLSKPDFVQRYARGEFGNAAPTWQTLNEWQRHRKGLVLDRQYMLPNRLYHIRNRVAGADTWYNLPADKVEATWDLALYAGYAPEQLYISEMAPTERTLIQGEVQQSIEHLDLLYTTVAKPMRDALRERNLRINGLAAMMVLKNRMCPNSWEWLNLLLERYPDHVVEFSTYSVDWGTVAGYNTVFWEVRNY